MEFGDIFNYTFRILRQKFPYIYLAMGWIFVPISFFYNYYSFHLGDAMTVAPGQEIPVSPWADLINIYLVFLIFLLIQQILYPLTNAGVIKIVSGIMHGDDVSVKEIFPRIFSNLNWLKLLGLGIIITVSYLLGGLFLFLPTLLFIVMFCMSTTVLMIEQKSVLSSLTRSWSLAWNHLGRVIPVLLVMGLLAYVISYVVTIPVSVLMSIILILEVDASIWFFFMALLTSLLELLAAPIPVLAVTLMYFDLRARREGIDLEQRIKEIETDLECQFQL